MRMQMFEYTSARMRMRIFNSYFNFYFMRILRILRYLDPSTDNYRPIYRDENLPAFAGIPAGPPISL